MLDGAKSNAAAGAAILYGAVGLVVPLVGRVIAYLLLRSQLGAARAVHSGPVDARPAILPAD